MRQIIIIIFILFFFVYLLPQNNYEVEKKYDFEISLGLSLSKPSELFYRASGINTLLHQYIEIEKINYSFTGKFKENIIVIPINISINYNISQKWFLKAGLEYGFGSNSSEKTYQLRNINEISEDHTFNLKNKVSYFMPFVGAGIRISSFTLYSNLGLNFTHFTHTYLFDYSADSYWHEINNTYKTNGIGIGIILGCQYKIKIRDKIKFIFKLEYFNLNIGTLKGKKESLSSNSSGGSFSEITDGTIYAYEMNPYETGWFNFWELHKSSPDDSWIRNVNNMNLNLSSIRIMIGYTF